MNRIKVGIIGCGRISDLHAKGYQQSEDAEIYAVCDRNEELAGQRKSEWGAAEVFTDYKKMLEDSDLDAVDILTPHTLHEEMVLASLAAGKHTAVQKPVSIDLDSTDRMINAAENSGLVFKVTENYIFYPPIIKARELIESGEIGKPQNIRINLIGAGAGGWEIPKEAWAWRMKEFTESRGMETFDHGHHLWSTVCFLMGGISEISAWIGNTEGMVDAPAVVMWKHEEEGRYGNCTFSYCNAMEIPSDYYANDEWIDITGSKGILRINRCTGKLIEGPVLSLFNENKWTHFNDIEDDWQAGFTGAVENFIRSIRGEAEAGLSGKESREILKINLAVQKSSRTQQSVFLNELDNPLPLISNAVNRNKNRSSNRKFMKSLTAESGTGKNLSAEAAPLTMALSERADCSKIGDWQGRIGLELSSDESEALLFSLILSDQKLEVINGKMPVNPDLIISTSASLWAGILSGKKKIQTAFLQGRLKFKGDMEHGFKLKEIAGF